VIGNAFDDPRFTRAAQPFKAGLGHRYSGGLDCFEDRLAGVHQQLLARLLQDDRKSSISSGLAPEELVVVDGTEKLREGSKVDIRSRNEKPTQAGTPPLADSPPPEKRP